MKKNLLLLASIFALLSTANAQNTWYVDKNASGMSTGANWNDAYNELAYAMLTASPGDIIWVAQGTYYPTLDSWGNSWVGGGATHWFKENITVLGGFDGTENFEWQRDPVNQKAILDGAGVCENVCNLQANGITLDGFRISGGYSTTGSSNLNGAGILISSNSLTTLRNLEIVNNWAENHGGGLYANNATDLLVENCAFLGNYTGNYDGAGLYLNGSDAIMNNCLFFNNSSARFGSAVTTVSSNLEANNCTFYRNVGAVNGFQHSTSGIVRYYHCILDSDFDDDGLDLATSGSASVAFNECLLSPDFYLPATKNSCLTQNATFTDPGNLDFTQTAASAGVEMAISMTSSNTTTIDLNGNARLIGSYMDLGAYELCSVNTSVSQSNEVLSADQNGATYQWINCTTNQSIPGATTQSYTATANGDYAVIVSFGAGCADTSSCYTVSGLGLEEMIYSNIEIYPNPASDMLVVSGIDGFDEIIVSSLGGQQVLTSNSKNLNVSMLEEGVYLVTIVSNGATTTRRFVKK